MAVPASHLPHRARQGELVYARRPQAVDQAPDFADGGPDLAIQARGRALGGLQVERDQIGYRACLQGQAGQSGSEAVVQVAAQPPPLFFSRSDQPHPGTLKVAGQRRGVHRRADLAGEIAQQAGVARGNRLTVPPPADQELSHLGRLVLQGQAQQVRGRLAVLGRDDRAITAADGDRDIAQLEGGGESLHSARQRLMLDGGGQPAAELGDNCVRLLPLAVAATLRGAPHMTWVISCTASSRCRRKACRTAAASLARRHVTSRLMPETPAAMTGPVA